MTEIYWFKDLTDKVMCWLCGLGEWNGVYCGKWGVDCLFVIMLLLCLYVFVRMCYVCKCGLNGV